MTRIKATCTAGEMGITDANGECKEESPGDTIYTVLTVGELQE